MTTDANLWALEKDEVICGGNDGFAGSVYLNKMRNMFC